MPDGSLTALEVLALAGLGDRPRYGYELVERIEALSRGRVSVRPGNLYRVIHRLEERGLVREEPGAGEGEDARRQYFVATEEGRARAVAELEMYAGVLDRVPALARPDGA